MIEENHTEVATVIFIHNTSFKKQNKKKLINMANILVEHFSS
jgi:endonuclease III